MRSSLWSQVGLDAFVDSRFIKKPLTPLSPNKSWEGFIGGGVFCIIIGEIIAWALERPHLYCPFNQPNCEIPSYYVPTFYAFPALIQKLFGISGITLKPIFIHEFVIALFASLVAPFGGFFASAIKRAYGKKDFAEKIPGHGGLMDRFDCMFIMLYFTSIYYNTFVREKEVTVSQVLRLIAKLTPADQSRLLNTLTGQL